MKSRTLALLAALLVALTHMVAAAPYRLIGVNTGTDQVVEINQTDGSLTVLMTLPFDAETYQGFDYNPADGFLYLAVGNGSNQVGFHRLNLAAQTTTLVKTFSTVGDGTTESIGFTPTGDVYAYDERSAFSTGTMYFINWNTGAVTALGSSGTPSILGGDYDAGRGVFWASDEWNAKVYQLSTTNSSVLWTSTSTWYPGVGPGDVLDIDVAPNGDVLVGATDDVFKVLKLDPSSGVWTTVITLATNPDFRIATLPISNVNTSGLVGHWTFSGNANDSSGNGKHGVVTGATLMPDRFGVADRAYHFTQSDKIETTANLGISGNTARTLSLWVKFEQPSTWPNGNMLAWGNNSGLGTQCWLGFYSPSNSRLAMDGYYVGWESQPNLSLVGSWQHVVWSYY